MTAARWSSAMGGSLSAIAAAVGLGSIWRFPYLAGTQGGFAFVFAFLIVCSVVALPLLTFELTVGRWGSRSPPQAVGEVAAQCGLSRRWNLIGWLGTLGGFLIITYYTMIAGWTLAYAWHFLIGAYEHFTPEQAAQAFPAFVSDARRLIGWHWLFLLIVCCVTSRGVNRGVEWISRWRGPVLLGLLLVLVGFSLSTGAVARGLSFAFAPQWAGLTAGVWLSATSQAFYAIGVGIGIMLAYGAYMPPQASLLRTSVAVTGAILVVSLLSTVLIFPLVFKYGLNPAQGPELVFQVLPAAFVEMPAGRLVGVLFFAALAVAALTPSIAGLEPLIQWSQERFGLSRVSASIAVVALCAVLGLLSDLSFGPWAGVRPLQWLGFDSNRGVFDTIDLLSASIIVPFGVLVFSVWAGWWVPADRWRAQLVGVPPLAQRLLMFLVRWVCPPAIAVLLVAGLR